MVEVDTKELHKLLRYEPETGKLFWRKRPLAMFANDQAGMAWNTKYAGKEAFTAGNGKGYRKGNVFNKRYFAHRVIWALVYGKWPKEVDHINGDPGDNRIENLRAVSRAENAKNLKRPRDNTSGVVGVCWDKRRRTWNARIGIAGKKKNLGCFKKKADAMAARARAELECGYHPNHGRKAGDS